MATRRQLGGFSREFSSIPVTRRRHPDNEQKNRDAQCAPKNGQKPKPSRWPAYTSSVHRKGQKPSPATGVFFYRVSALPGGTGDQRRRYFETERSCSLQVDDEFEFGGALDGQVGRLRAFENAAHIDAS